MGKLTLSLRRAICRAIKEINFCAKCDCSITRVQPTRPISKQAEQKSNNRDSTVGEQKGEQQAEHRERTLSIESDKVAALKVTQTFCKCLVPCVYLSNTVTLDLLSGVVVDVVVTELD